jgi:hypothetical protein
MASDTAAIRDALGRLDKVHFQDRDKVLFALLAGWGELEPKAAFGYAQKLKTDDSSVAVAHVIKAWCANEPAEAEKWIEELPPSATKDAAYAGMIEALAASDPRRAFALVQKAPAYSNSVEALFSAWVDLDPQEAAAFAVQLPAGFARGSALDVTARNWARRDRPAALAWAESLPAKDASIPGRTPVLAMVLNEWIDEAPEEAIEWIEKMPDEQEREKALGGIITQLSFDNREMAARLTTLISPGKDQDQALQQLAYQWSMTDPDAALAWLTQQDNEHFREVFLPQLTWPLAGKDPHRALELALSIGGKARDQSVSNVLKSWAQTDPSAAADWATANGMNPEYLSSIAATWIRMDQQAATDWAAALPEGPSKDNLLSKTAQEFVETLPELAVAWTAGITDETQRLAAYTQIAERWLLWDRNAAREWLADAPLPIGVKEKLLKDYAP